MVMHREWEEVGSSEFDSRNVFESLNKLDCPVTTEVPVDHTKDKLYCPKCQMNHPLERHY